MRPRLWVAPAALLAASLLWPAAAPAAGGGGDDLARDGLIASVYPVVRPRGLMVTSGGWAYCAQVGRLARQGRYTLLCGRYAKDGYLGPGLRARRQLDWGNPRYLAELASRARELHGRIGGNLVLIGVSYSGFGVAVLASKHPELRPTRLIVIDSYLDLLARRQHASPTHPTAAEIDRETGGSPAALRARSVSVDGLVRLVRTGTRLTVIWTIAEEERRFFRGVTCDATASAETLARLASALGRPVDAWVTWTRHGQSLWRDGLAIVEGRNPGTKVVFRPGAPIPAGATCG